MRYFHLQRCEGLAVLPDDAINPDQLVQASLRLNVADNESTATGSS